jgi:LemA protein
MAALIVALVGGSGCTARKMQPTYDELVGLRENVAKEWAGVDAHLQRRYDLIPNLVEVAKAAAAHESNVFVEITAARERYVTATTVSERIEASYRTEIVLRRMAMVVHGSYPTLEAIGRFADLMRTLERTEDRLLAQRIRYNEAVKAFNTRQKSIGGRFVSTFTSFEPATYYDPPALAKEPPVVTFASSATPSASASAAPPPPAPIKYALKGFMTAGGHREAILVGPNCESVNVAVGSLLGHEKVTAIDDTGVTLGDGESTRRVE